VSNSPDSAAVNSSDSVPGDGEAVSGTDLVRPDLGHPDLGHPDLARLGHELRTPLSAISVLSEIIRDERLGPLDDPRYRAYAADIHEGARQAMRVLSGFVEQMADGAAAGLPMDFIELDARELVIGAVSAFAPLAERSGVAIRTACPDSLPHLIADRRSVRQMLDNLMANALKFTPPGGTITVALSYAVGGPIVLSVADTGDGMTDAELARARSGTVAPEPLLRRSGGTGYGLPLVRVLATASGATLAIDSRLRAGSRIAITFPHDRVVPV
jgi:two-component system cell cycle sensor histidine kinase PleC